MYRKYLATAAAILVSVSMMMTGCSGNHAVKDNNVQQTEAVNAQSEDGTRSGAVSKTGTKQGTQKEGNTTGSAAQKRENQKTGDGTGGSNNSTNNNKNENNIYINNGNGNSNGNGGSRQKTGSSGSGRTTKNQTNTTYNIYETHNHNTTNKTENHYSTTHNSKTENKYTNTTTENVNVDQSIGKTTVNQEQNITENSTTNTTNTNINLGDQSNGKTTTTTVNNEEDTTITKNETNTVNQNNGNQAIGSGNDQGGDAYAYEPGNLDHYTDPKPVEGDTGDEDTGKNALLGFGGSDSGNGSTDPDYEDPVIGTTADEVTDEEPVPAPTDGFTDTINPDEPVDDIPGEGTEDIWPDDPEPEYPYEGTTTDIPEEYVDEPVDDIPYDGGDDWYNGEGDGEEEYQGDDFETFDQNETPGMMEEPQEMWETNDSTDSADISSEGDSLQVSSGSDMGTTYDVSGHSTISFTVGLAEGSDLSGSAWIEVCDQDGNVIGQTGEVGPGRSTNANFDVSGMDTIQFRACTDSGEMVDLQISSLVLN
jgi:hypothetical protein